MNVEYNMSLKVVLTGELFQEKRRLFGKRWVIYRFTLTPEHLLCADAKHCQKPKPVCSTEDIALVRVPKHSTLAFTVFLVNQKALQFRARSAEDRSAWVAGLTPKRSYTDRFHLSPSADAVPLEAFLNSNLPAGKSY